MWREKSQPCWGAMQQKKQISLLDILKAFISLRKNSSISMFCCPCGTTHLWVHLTKLTLAHSVQGAVTNSDLQITQRRKEKSLHAINNLLRVFLQHTHLILA